MDKLTDEQLVTISASVFDLMSKSSLIFEELDQPFTFPTPKLPNGKPKIWRKNMYNAELREDDIFATKLGGYPYVPRHILNDATAVEEYKKRGLIIQINCQDINPTILPNYPTCGILQVFAAPPRSEDEQPAGKGDKNYDFRGHFFFGSSIKYFEEVDTTITRNDIVNILPEPEIEDDDTEYPMVWGQCQLLKLTPGQTICWSHQTVEKVMLQEINKVLKSTDDSDNGEELEIDYYEILERLDKLPAELRKNAKFEYATPSNLGGAYSWCQDDPFLDLYDKGEKCGGGDDDEDNDEEGQSDDEENKMGLFTRKPSLNIQPLLYLDSFSILCWGDCGTASWFVTPEELEERNFNNHFFNYDCC